MRFLSLLFCFCQMSLQAGISDAMMLQTVDIIKNTLEVGYAPTLWKEKWNGWNLEDEVEKTKTKITNKNLSLKEYHNILKEFLNSTTDYHVGITFFSTEHAYLPLRVKGVNGRYFITHINRDILGIDEFSFEKGDELISFGGKKTHEEILNIRCQDLGFKNEETDISLAEGLLTYRDGTLGQNVPKGDIELTVQSKATGIISNHTLSWIYFPEKIASQKPIVKGLDCSPKKLLSEVVKNEFIFSRLSKLKQDDLFDDNLDELGRDKGFLPTLGKKLWFNEESLFFHAYLFESPNKKKIGYVRIPTFMGSIQESDEFKNIIGLFQDEADALIIDQLSNPGGYLFFLYSICSMLTDTPLKTFKHTINITQRDMMISLTLLPLFDEIKTDDDAKYLFEETFDGFELDGIEVNLNVAKCFESYFRYVISEWELGNTVMDPCYLYGLDEIKPNGYTCYTKPLLVLTNGLDFSCGDFFPAIMQDNNRGVIMGSRTAGAGGIVKTVSFPNLLGIESYSYTASIAKRNDLVLENLGVTPDILCDVTENDIRNNYEDYVSKILETIDSMVIDDE